MKKQLVIESPKVLWKTLFMNIYIPQQWYQFQTLSSTEACQTTFALISQFQISLP